LLCSDEKASLFAKLAAAVKIPAVILLASETPLSLQHFSWGDVNGCRHPGLWNVRNICKEAARRGRVISESTPDMAIKKKQEKTCYVTPSSPEKTCYVDAVKVISTL
jgi:hypothetical protein